MVRLKWTSFVDQKNGYAAQIYIFYAFCHALRYEISGQNKNVENDDDSSFPGTISNQLNVITEKLKLNLRCDLVNQILVQENYLFTSIIRERNLDFLFLKGGSKGNSLYALQIC